MTWCPAVASVFDPAAVPQVVVDRTAGSRRLGLQFPVDAPGAAGQPDDPVALHGGFAGHRILGLGDLLIDAAQSPPGPKNQQVTAVDQPARELLALIQELRS